MASWAWSTQQLAEFVASVSSCTTEASAARAAVERAADALDAEVAAPSPSTSSGAYGQVFRTPG